MRPSVGKSGVRHAASHSRSPSPRTGASPCGIVARSRRSAMPVRTVEPSRRCPWIRRSPGDFRYASDSPPVRGPFTLAQFEGSGRFLTIRTFGLSGLGQHERPRSPSVSRPGRTRAEGTQSTVKLTVERLPESQVRLDIAADEAEFAEAVEKPARKVSRDIVLPGFRKGKVPRHMIERMYGREVFLEEAGRLIMDDLYRKALEQEDLTPVGSPDVQITQMDPVAFTVEVPIYPSVEPGDYTAVRAEPEDAAIREDDVDEVLQRLRKASSPWIDPSEERKAQEGDQVTLDLSMTDENGEQFQEPIENAQFIIGESK